MSSFPKSVFIGGPASIWRRFGCWPAATRTLSTRATVVFARLKDLAPYALIEILLPGGSMLALTLWLYRRRKKRRKQASEEHLSKRVEQCSQHLLPCADCGRTGFGQY